MEIYERKFKKYLTVPLLLHPTVDESVPEFANQYQYQKNYSVQYETSTSTTNTDQI